MSPIKILIDLDLLSWSTILLGMEKGWIRRKDVIDYAVQLLIRGCDDENIAVIASGRNFNDDELLSWISSHIKQSDKTKDFEKWRLACLLSLDESIKDKQAKLDKLQEIYADFNYPEDMASCSIYSQDKISPLVAMEQVIQELKNKLY